MELEKAMEVEYEHWLDLVERLKATGAVTQRDCESPLSEIETPGQQLFQAIRQWGDSLVSLRIEQSSS